MALAVLKITDDGMENEVSYEEPSWNQGDHLDLLLPFLFAACTLVPSPEDLVVTMVVETVAVYASQTQEAARTTEAQITYGCDSDANGNSDKFKGEQWNTVQNIYILDELSKLHYVD